MAETFECRRELIVDRSADHMWEWLSNPRNAMTANQFHMSAECDDAVARNPKAGIDIPILHKIMGREFYRIAKITRFQDFEISWGERLPDGSTYEDAFPHSEGWKIESLGPNQCRLRNHLRGAFMLPIGKLIGRQAWDASMPTILDNDLQDVAFGAGAIAEKRVVEMPNDGAALLRLVNAREIDGIAVRELLNAPPPLLKNA